jgi:hypothetical protein
MEAQGLVWCYKALTLAGFGSAFQTLRKQTARKCQPRAPAASLINDLWFGGSVARQRVADHKSGLVLLVPWKRLPPFQNKRIANISHFSASTYQLSTVMQQVNYWHCRF